MGSSPSPASSCGGDCPVENVSWHDAQGFLRTLKQRTGRDYRLPTEAEWEYAARSGGKNEIWAGTNILDEVPDYAWVYTNSKLELHPVGQKKPNGLGLYDMSGNAWEWVGDWYDRGYYAKSPKRDPQGPATGELRCARGGFWGDLPRLARVSRRIGIRPDTRADGYGFRIAVSAP
jgi:formylglycine-generating enzyme required for sulfatase activity